MNATTNAVPTVSRYLYASTAIVNGTSLTVSKTQFVDDTGAKPTAITTAIANNGYYLLYVNGELQQSGIYAVTQRQTDHHNNRNFHHPAQWHGRIVHNELPAEHNRYRLKSA